jgi:hypothetical protein
MPGRITRLEPPCNRLPVAGHAAGPPIELLSAGFAGSQQTSSSEFETIFNVTKL